MKRFVDGVSSLLTVTLIGVSVHAAEPVKQVRVLKGHQNKVTSVAVSLDGKRILSSSDDDTIRKWELDSGKQLDVWRDHDEFTLCVTYSPDGRLAASGGGGSLDSRERFCTGKDHAVRIYNARSGEVLQRLKGHVAPVWCLAFSPDGRHLVSGSGGWKMKDGELVLAMNGRRIPMGFELILWDVKTGRKVRSFDGHENWIRGVAFTRDGETIISASWDETVRLWDTDSGTEKRTFGGHDTLINALDISADGTRVVSGDGRGKMVVWDVKAGEMLRRFEEPSKSLWSVSISSDGRYAVSGSTNGVVRLWDTQSGKETARFEGHSDVVRDARFTPDGRHIVTASHDETIRLLKVPMPPEE